MKYVVETLVISAVLAGSSLSAQNQICIPQFVDGTSGEFRWETTLVVHNQEAHQAQVQFHFFDADGQPMQGLMMGPRGGQGTHQPVGPGGQFSPAPMHGRGAVSHRSRGQGGLQAGFCVVESPDRVRVHSRLHLYDAEGNLLSETGIIPGPHSRTGSFWFDRRPGLDVGLALTNTAAGLTATVTLEIYDEDGTLLGSTELQLGPRSQKARMLVELFPELLTGDVGYIVISADNPVCALALQLRGLRMFQVPIFVLDEEDTF